MKRRPLLTAGVVCLVLLAGCASLSGSYEESDASPTARPTDRPTTTVTTTSSQPTATSEPWSKPEPPNQPFERKLDGAQGNRIESVTVGGTGSGEGEYSSVTLNVTANTSLRNVDPPDHGTVRGEPRLLAYANASIVSGRWYTNVNGMLLERSELLAQEDNGTFSLTIPQRAFEETGVERGSVVITVLLVDGDSKWSDLYGIERVKIEYDAAA